MNQIRLRLERALNLQHKHEQSTSAVEGTTSNHLKGKSLDHLRLQLSDIESATDDNWVAKIADFGLSKLQSATQQGSTVVTNNIAGTEVYLDPEYLKTANWVANRLKKALEFQEDYEIWGPKLPIDYEEIIRVSNTPEIYKKKLKKDLYNMFSKGILLQDGKVWFWLGKNGERNEMISAKRFSYKNHLLRKWRSIPESRFPKAEHEEIQKLNDIQQVLKSKSKADKFRFSPSNMKVKKDHMTWYSLSRIKRKKDEMLSATNVVYNSSSVAILSRFSGAIEFLPRQSTKASTIGHEVTRYARMLESCGVKATYARKDEDVEERALMDIENL
ncbi:hypothetical protein L1987_86815 [Smallanthus sonchifolius]|uniref:Uncharacterized protein n=1 Tax=Smallanthus sonchifolius TaxID=185202 RepID=A0ACB8Y168_9ASTR|nr:hypothetical protein L1987_86815 [Smallanthus sonchifolius]